MMSATMLGVLVVLAPVWSMEKEFFETLDDIGRIQRSLLQAEEGSGEMKVEGKKKGWIYYIDK